MKTFLLLIALVFLAPPEERPKHRVTMKITVTYDSVSLEDAARVERLMDQYFTGKKVRFTIKIIDAPAKPLLWQAPFPSLDSLATTPWRFNAIPNQRNEEDKP